MTGAQAMPVGKKKHESPFTGRWHIASMDEWDMDYMEEAGRRSSSSGPTRWASSGSA
jgi:hypothetical protein